MLRLELTLPTPAENLALDEALLECAEEGPPERQFLRLWESPQPIVVVGRSSRVEVEVDLTECERRQIPVVRRSSGGAAVVAGPGCLMYAVVLSYQLQPELQDIGAAHRFVLGRIANALRPRWPGVRHMDASDLAIGESTQRKFAGNSLRAKRSHLLYHGTLLYDFDLPLVTACLQMPPRQPDYRGARSHADFLTNLPATRPELVDALSRAWPTVGELAEWPRQRVEQLVAQRFGQDQWNLVFG